MGLLKKSSTVQPLMFQMIDSSDHVSTKTGLTPTVTLSKAGGAFASPAGAISEISDGWYKVAGNATDTNTLGPLVLHAKGTGADPTDVYYDVVAFDPQVATNLGLSALPTANPEATGGLPTVNADGAVKATDSNGDDLATSVALALLTSGTDSVAPAGIGGMTTEAYRLQARGQFHHYSIRTFRPISEGENDNGTESPNLFAPTGFPQFDEWMLFSDWTEADMVCWTANQAGGFQLNPSTETVHNITHSAWYAANGNPDLTLLYARSARAFGKKLGIYCTIRDLYYDLHSGAQDATSYTQHTKNIISELMAYGPDYIFFDSWNSAGGGSPDYVTNNIAQIYAHVKSINPRCVVVINGIEDSAYHGDGRYFDVASQESELLGELPPFRVPLPEENTTFQDWYHYTDSDFSNVQHIAFNTLELRERCGQQGKNSVVNFPPSADGHMDPYLWQVADLIKPRPLMKTGGGDNFLIINAESVGVHLDAHTSDISTATWTRLGFTGNLIISPDGYLRGDTNSINGGYLYSATPDNDAGAKIEFMFRTAPTASNTLNIGVKIRSNADASACYRGVLYNADSSTTVNIVLNDAGGNTLDSTIFTMDYTAKYRMTLVPDGSKIRLLLHRNGYLVRSLVGTPIVARASGQVGIEFVCNPTTDTTGLAFESFEIVKLNTTAPDAPAGVAAIGSDDAIALTWSGVLNAEKYGVMRSTDGVTYTRVGTARDITQFVDTTVTTGTTYSYRVKAIDASLNESALSAAVATVAVSATPSTTATGSGQYPIDHDGGSGAASADIQIFIPYSSGSHTGSSTDVLRYTSNGTTGVAGLTVKAYLASSYDAGIRTAAATTFTGSDGRWLSPLMLNSGTFYIIADSPGDGLASNQAKIVIP